MPDVIVFATAVSSVTGCGESFLIFHVSAVGAMIVPSALTRHGTDVGTLMSILSSGEVCAVFALSACACGGGYHYCCCRDGDECRDEACLRSGCRSVSHFSCCLLLASCRILFFFSSYRYEFPASSVPFRCLVPYSPALYGVMSTGRGCRVRFASVSSRRIVSSSRSVSSFRFRLVSSIRLVSTRAAIRFARYGRREGSIIRLFIWA